MATIAIKLTDEAILNLEKSKANYVSELMGWLKGGYNEIRSSGVPFYILVNFNLSDDEFAFDDYFVVQENYLFNRYRFTKPSNENQFFEVFPK